MTFSKPSFQLWIRWKQPKNLCSQKYYRNMRNWTCTLQNGLLMLFQYTAKSLYIFPFFSSLEKLDPYICHACANAKWSFFYFNYFLRYLVIFSRDFTLPEQFLVEHDDFDPTSGSCILDFYYTVLLSSRLHESFIWHTLLCQYVNVLKMRYLLVIVYVHMLLCFHMLKGMFLYILDFIIPWWKY